MIIIVTPEFEIRIINTDIFLNTIEKTSFFK